LAGNFLRQTWVKREKKVTVNNDLPSFKVLSLLSICVAKNAKGTGVSKALVEEFEKRVKQLGYEGYTLTVRKANNRANNFYKKIGMDIYKESDSEYGYIKKLIDS
jgi:ribosomal protein S18 acetylase RimI-like enzyme